MTTNLLKLDTSEDMSILNRNCRKAAILAGHVCQCRASIQATPADMQTRSAFDLSNWVIAQCEKLDLDTLHTHILLI